MQGKQEMNAKTCAINTMKQLGGQKYRRRKDTETNGITNPQKSEFVLETKCDVGVVGEESRHSYFCWNEGLGCTFGRRF